MAHADSDEVGVRSFRMTSSDDLQAGVWPELYLVSVGVSVYQRSELRLQYAAKDAHDLAEVFKKQEGQLYKQVKTRVLVDEQATKIAILDALEWLLRQSTAKDIVIFLLAGHGIIDPRTDRYYYFPYEADPERILATSLSGNELRDTLAAVAGHKRLLFLDTCHAGRLFPENTGFRGGGDISHFIRDFERSGKAGLIMASSSGHQLSAESTQWANGAFTRALVEGLHGKADINGEGLVTVGELIDYVCGRVKELTDGRQTPEVRFQGSNFPLAVTEATLRQIAEAARKKEKEEAAARKKAEEEALVREKEIERLTNQQAAAKEVVPKVAETPRWRTYVKIGGVVAALATASALAVHLVKRDPIPIPPQLDLAVPLDLTVPPSPPKFSAYADTTPIVGAAVLVQEKGTLSDFHCSPTPCTVSGIGAGPFIIKVTKPYYKDMIFEVEDRDKLIDALKDLKLVGE